MLIKKIFSVSVLIAAAFVLFAFFAGAVEISAKSAVVIDASTNEILFQKNAFEKRSMASTTKIMTAIIAIESGKLNNIVTVTEQMIRAEGTCVGLCAGYKITLYDLVYGMMLESGNDAANAVAVYLAGSLKNFAIVMNRKAEEIGMKNSSFVTPSGLDDEEHYSTAFDMAVLASYCVKNPIFKSVCSSKKYTAELVSPSSGRFFFSNHNRLLSSVDGVFGVKTGFTKKSGRCLVSAIEKNGVVLVAVTLSAPDDWNDHKKLYSACFESFDLEKIEVKYPKKIAVVGGKSSFVGVRCEKDSVEISVQSNAEITQKTFLPRFVYAAVKENDFLGRVEFYGGGRVVKTVFLFAAESVEPEKETYVRKKCLIEKIKDKLIYLFKAIPHNLGVRFAQ